MQGDLYQRCLAFVQDQSSGEWGDPIESEDAKKLLAFVQSETRTLEAQIAELRSVLEELQPVACGDWCSDGKHIPECARAMAALQHKEPQG